MRGNLFKSYENPTRLRPLGGVWRANPYHPMNFGLLFSYIFAECGGNTAYDMAGRQNAVIVMTEGSVSMWGITHDSRYDLLNVPNADWGVTLNGTQTSYITLPSPTVEDFTLVSDHANLWQSANYPTDFGWADAAYNNCLLFYSKHLVYSNNVHFSCRVGSGTEVHVNPTTNPVKERHIWMATRNATSGAIQFFKDGVSLGAPANSNTGSWAMPPGRIGMDGQGANAAIATVFRFEMYNRILSAQEIAWHQYYAYPYGTFDNPRFIRSFGYDRNAPTGQIAPFTGYFPMSYIA